MDRSVRAGVARACVGTDGEASRVEVAPVRQRPGEGPERAAGADRPGRRARTQGQPWPAVRRHLARLGRPGCRGHRPGALVPWKPPNVTPPEPGLYLVRPVAARVMTAVGLRAYGCWGGPTPTPTEPPRSPIPPDP